MHTVAKLGMGLLVASVVGLGGPARAEKAVLPASTQQTVQNMKKVRAAIIQNNLTAGEYKAAKQKAAIQALKDKTNLATVSIDAAKIKAAVGTTMVARAQALAQLNDLLGYPGDQDFGDMRLHFGANTQEPNGELKQIGEGRPKNVQTQRWGSSELFWKPAEMTFSINTFKVESTGQVLVLADFRCIKDKECVRIKYYDHPNAAVSTLTSTLNAVGINSRELSIPADQAEAYFQQIDTVLSYLQTHPN